MRIPPIIHPAVGAVIFRGDDVLLIKRGTPPLQGQWSIPGGKVNFGESLHAALHREIREETGVTIDIIELINVFESLPTPNQGNKHYVMIDYVARWRSGNVVPGDDACDACFVPYDDALTWLAWDQTRTALAQAKAVFVAAQNNPA